MTMQEQTHRADVGTEPVTPRPAQSPEASGAAPGRLPDDVLGIVPVRNVVLFPGIVMPLSLGRPKSIAAAQEAARSQRRSACCSASPKPTTRCARSAVREVGCLAGILRYVTAPDGNHTSCARARQRFRVREFVPGYPFLAARIERIEARPHARDRGPPVPAEGTGARGPATAAAGAAGADQRHAGGERRIRRPPTRWRASWICGPRRSSRSWSRSICAPDWTRSWSCSSTASRCSRSRDIGQQTKDAVEGRQRGHILREQLKAIQKELGETEGTAAGIQELDRAIAEAGMPEAEQQAQAEAPGAHARSRGRALDGAHLSRLADRAAVVEAERGRDRHAEARRILDEDHYGLPKIKRRILEYLAVRKLNPQGE